MANKSEKPEVEVENSMGATLEVEGYTWQGYKSRYAYSVDSKNPPKTYAECKRIAGDFESLITAKVVTCKTVTRRTITTVSIV